MLYFQAAAFSIPHFNLLAKPKLLIVLNRLAIGGPATNTLAVAHELSSDFEILLVAGDPMHNEESAAYLLQQYNSFEVQIIHSFKRAVLPFNDFSAYKKLKAIIKNFKPDIIHTHGSKPGVLARFAAWQCNVPVIIHTYHGHVFHSYFNTFISKGIVGIERWFAKHTTYLIAINNRIKDDLENKYRIASKDKVVLNRLGIDVEFYFDEDGLKRKKFRQEFSLHDDTVAIAIIGRLVPVKQHTLFVDLVEQLLTTLPKEKKVQFFIIGDGNEKKKIENLLQKKHISFSNNLQPVNNDTSVLFTSWRKDIDFVLAGLDMVVLTSLNEGTPVSIMEAMAASKPVVATNVGGISELLINEETGFVFENQQDIKTSMLRLLQSKELREKMGSNAKDFAKRHLSIRTQVAQLKDIYLPKK